MKAKLRRVHVRIDVTTAASERRAVIVDARPGTLRGLLLRLVLSALAGEGLELVDELEQPAVAEGDTFEAGDTEPPSADESAPLAPRLTVARAAAVPSHPADAAAPVRLPPASPAATPSAKLPAPAGDLDAAAPVKRAAAHTRRHPAPMHHADAAPVRIEAAPPGPPADHVIAPNAVAPVAAAPALAKAAASPARSTSDSDAHPVVNRRSVPVAPAASSDTAPAGK